MSTSSHNHSAERGLRLTLYCCLQVTIRKPLGLVLGEAERGGAVVVEEIVKGGNAEQTGAVQVGDIVSRCDFDEGTWSGGSLHVSMQNCRHMLGSK